MTKPKSKRKREAVTPAKDKQPVVEEPATEKFSPQLKLDFSKTFSPKQATISFSGKSDVPNLTIHALVAGKHLLVVIPGYKQSGWVDNLNVGIALCKVVDMRGFKLPDDVSGDNRFGYYTAAVSTARS